MNHAAAGLARVSRCRSPAEEPFSAGWLALTGMAGRSGGTFVHGAVLRKIPPASAPLGDAQPPRPFVACRMNQTYQPGG